LCGSCGSADSTRVRRPVQCRSRGARPRAPCVSFDRSPCCNIMATIEATTEMSRTSRNRREWTQCRHFAWLMFAVNHCDALGELSHSYQNGTVGVTCKNDARYRAFE